MIGINERDHLIKTKLILFPDSHFRAFSDMIVLLAVIYSSLMLPIQVAFDDFNIPYFLIVLDTVFDVVFMLDIFLNFNTGIYEKGILVMQRKRITEKYLKSWFFLDLLSSFPYNWFVAAAL